MTRKAENMQESSATVDRLVPGTELLHGHYVIEDFLASGGFGITYLAKDNLERRIVLKECYPDILCCRDGLKVAAKDPEQTGTFQRIVKLFVEEARKVARMKHPNIVVVYQVFEDYGTAYMALEYIDGRELLDVVRGTDRLKAEDIERCTLKLLDAVDHIHKEGILHRDIAPDNILVSVENQPILIDFGAARETDPSASKITGALRAVKEGYSPPEFYEVGATHYPSSDLYGLAASLYHVIAGQAPESAKIRMSAIEEGQADPYVSIVDRAEGFSPEYLKCIDKALSLAPEDRLQSAEEWVTLLAKSNVVLTPDFPIKATEEGTILEPFASAFIEAIPSSVSVEQPQEDPQPIASAPIADTPPPGRSNGALYAGALLLAGAAIAGTWFFLSQGSDPAVDVVAETSTPTSDSVLTQPNTTFEPVPAEEAPGAVLAEQSQDSADVTTDAPAPSADVSADVVGVPTAPPAVEQAQATDPSPSTEAIVQETAAPAPAITPVPRKTAADMIEDVSGVRVTSLVEFPVLPDISDPNLVLFAGDVLAGKIVPGQRITSANGIPVASLKDIPRIISETAYYDAGEHVTISFEVLEKDAQTAALKDITLPTVKDVELANGARFRAHKQGDDWIITVVSVGRAGKSDLREGDQLVSFMPSNEPITSAETLAEILRREIDSGATRMNFSAKRGDKFWFAKLEYDVNS